MIKTGYEGKKIDKDGMIECTYNGVDKINKHYSERRTVHFTINSPVESHGYGNFDETDFVVLEPYSYHESEYISVAVPDTWTRNSVRLSNEAILLVSEEQYQKLCSYKDLALKRVERAKDLMYYITIKKYIDLAKKTNLDLDKSLILPEIHEILDTFEKHKKSYKDEFERSYKIYKDIISKINNKILLTLISTSSNEIFTFTCF